MAKFNFYQDIKVSVWERQEFVVEAENKEEAIKKAKKFTNEDVSAYDNFVSSETLFDTEENIHPEDNNGCRTIEIFSEDDMVNAISHNGNC